MQQLLEAALAPANIVYTILLLIAFLYWVLVFIGALDFGSFDVDIDAEVDVDLDIDAELDADAQMDVGGMSALAGFLHFLNLGKVPFMVLFSFLAISLWMGSMLANHYWSNGSPWFPVALIFPNLFLGLIVTKAVTTPLVPVFKSLNTGVEAVDFIGLTCTITLAPTPNRAGQGEVLVDGTPLLVYVKAEPGADVLEKGEEGLLIRRSEDGKFFYVVRLKDLDEAKNM